MKIESWNKIGKIKSYLILFFCLVELLLLNFKKNSELMNEHYLGISFVVFIFVILFLTVASKLLSLFGIKFLKPNWNENPISLNLSKSFNFFQFVGYWFTISGIINTLFVGIFYQEIEKESIMKFSYGIALLIGITLSLKWLNKNEQSRTTI
ncbi:hypothetical protein [Polaribacter vadi]|uniref:hypothetical protein n=1 Tax=Polaribacter vadi TaxID=1774273 RepID=UPI0030EF2B35